MPDRAIPVRHDANSSGQTVTESALAKSKLLEGRSDVCPVYCGANAKPSQIADVRNAGGESLISASLICRSSLRREPWEQRRCAAVLTVDDL